MAEISEGLYRAGSGEQLLLLHGFTGTWHHWRPLLGELTARYEVIAPTLSGHDGGPPFPKHGPLTIGVATDSLEAHLDDLGVGVTHVVGNSMGGSLAIELAARGRAESVVALSPGGGWWPHSGQSERVARFFARQDRVNKFSQPYLKVAMAGPWRRKLAFRDAMRHGELVAPPDAIDIARTAARCDVVQEVLAALRSGSDALPDDFDRIEVPVLLAWAQMDRILPMQGCSERFRAQIPGAEFRVLPGVGHVPMWDDSRLVIDTIVEWVARHGAREGVAAQAAA